MYSPLLPSFYAAEIKTPSLASYSSITTYIPQQATEFMDAPAWRDSEKEFTTIDENCTTPRENY
jgi:hypothetical protein